MYYMKATLRLPEEFLWKLYESLEALNKVGKSLGPRSFRDVANPEWRELRVFYEEKKRKRGFVEFVSYLKQQGYIVEQKGKSVGALQLTRKGNQKALEAAKKIQELPVRRDGKMTMLMFDIPKNKERVRQVFRSTLELLDYQMLQKSVWVSDKEVLKETKKVIKEYGLNECINLFIIEKIRPQN
jgi:predicted transcriptional regulator